MSAPPSEETFVPNKGSGAGDAADQLNKLRRQLDLGQIEVPSAGILFVTEIGDTSSTVATLGHDGSFTPTGGLSVTSVTDPTSTCDITGGPADGASAVGVASDTNVAYSNSGAKLHSFRNHGTEKSYVDKDGGYNCTSANVRAGALYTQAYVLESNGAQALKLQGGAADGASAIGTKLNTHSAYTTAGAKITEFENNSVAKSYVDKDGQFVVSGDGFGFGLRGDAATQGMVSSGNITALRGTPVYLQSLSGGVNYVIFGTTGMTQLGGTTSILTGAGDPESSVAAPVGSLYLRTDGSTSTTLYVKTSGAAGNTGWTAK